MIYTKFLLILSIFIFTFSSSYAYRIKKVKKHEGYIESIIMCDNGKRTFVHKVVDKGYYASTYTHLNTFEEAVKASCYDGNITEPIEKKIYKLKHNAKVCKSIDAIERLLSSHKAYYYSLSRECFTAMYIDKVEVFNRYPNGNLIDIYYKVLYDDEIHYIRSNDMFVEDNLVPKNERLIKKNRQKKETSKLVNKKTKKLKKKNIKKKRKKYKTKKVRKKKVTKRVKKRKKYLKVYSCRAKSKSAIGWSNGTTLAKAKKSAIFQCSIRSKSSDTCKILKCRKKR